MARLASEYANQDVPMLSFEEIAFQDQFDGMWACSSTLHIPEKDMATIFSKLADSLKLGGVPYTSYNSGE